LVSSSQSLLDPIEEQVVLVDDEAKVIGAMPKNDVHTSFTPLHLAFSCYIFRGKSVLTTKRAAIKKVWPSVWTNSVCGHPAPEEPLDYAIKRRAQFELGLAIDHITSVLPNYRYKTPALHGIIENEICPVFFARASSEPTPNPDEVSEFRWMEWNQYVAELQSDLGDVWSWWSKDQLKQLRALPNLQDVLPTVN
jgi:isopentenyl-diphosphate Delta-isomerase